VRYNTGSARFTEIIAAPLLQSVLVVPVTGKIGEDEGTISIEFRLDEVVEVTTNEGADTFGDGGYNGEEVGIRETIGIEVIEPVELWKHCGSLPGRSPKEFGLVARIVAGFGDVGDERLLALPKICFAADATIQTPPPPPVPLKLAPFPADVKPERESSPGPPIPTAGPVRVPTSDAIVNCSTGKCQCRRQPYSVQEQARFPNCLKVE